MQLRSFIAALLLASLAAIANAQVDAPDSSEIPFDTTSGSSDACSEGIVLDDGSHETAYGWVPSVIWGEYVQTFDLQAYGPTVLEKLCVCLTRTREDDAIDFEVVLYQNGFNTPTLHPSWVFPASATNVPEYPDGRFYEIDLTGAETPVPPGIYHIGIRWNPSVDDFFFVCADQSPTDNPVSGFFRDDRAEGWGNVLDSADWIFDDHAAMLIRVVVRSVPWVPTTTLVGSLAFATMLFVLGVFALRRR